MFRQLLSPDENTVDSIHAVGIGSIAFLWVMSAVAFFYDHATWGAAGYAAAVVMIMGAMGGARYYRSAQGATSVSVGGETQPAPVQPPAA